MRAPSTAELLSVWERGVDQPPAVRALLLVAVAQPNIEWEALTRISIGNRDARLLDLREALFGPVFDCLTRCDHCAEQVELDFGVGDIRTPRAAAHATERVERDGYAVHFRVLDSADLFTLDPGHDLVVGERQLFARCVLDAATEAGEVAAHELPTSVIAAVAERMAEADPQAEVLLDLSCPACGGRWQAVFDIVSHLWAEIDGWAKTALRDVHTLARSYGWRETDILAMSPPRRRFYLDLLGA